MGMRRRHDHALAAYQAEVEILDRAVFGKP